MLTDTRREEIEHMIEEYTAGLEPSDVMIHEDPEISGTFAIRATFTDVYTHRTDIIDFLLIYDEDELEEVEYETWPPKSGSLKFFW